MEQDAITELEGLTWEPMIGKISGFTCKVAGRDWGCVMRSRTVAKGEGWTSTLCGFHTDLDMAKAAHAAAVVARKAALATPQEPKVAPLASGGMSAEEYCRLRGKVFIDPTLRRLKRMEERQAKRFTLN